MHPSTDFVPSNNPCHFCRRGEKLAASLSLPDKQRDKVAAKNIDRGIRIN